MNKVRIFLASSNELKEERQLFEIEIYRKTKKWIDKGVFLHLDIWEDLSAQMSSTHSQDEYNKYVKQADIVVVLAYTKLGDYTYSEFEMAKRTFSSTQKPFIYIYFKSNPPSTKENRKDLNTLYDFQDLLEESGYFYPSFNDFNDLWNRFNKELDRLEDNEFKKMPNESKNTTKEQTQNNSTITGNGNTVIQGMENSSYTDNSTTQNHSGSGDNVGGNKTSNQ